MATLAEAFSGFASGGGLGSIAKLATGISGGIGSISSAEEQAAAEKFAAWQESRKITSERRKLAREKRRALSSQKARFAKSGVDTLMGSPLEVMLETEMEFNKDLATLKGEEVMAKAMGHQRSKNIKKAGWIRGGNTILTSLMDFTESPLLKRKPA